MTLRIDQKNFTGGSPLYRAMLDLERAVAGAGLERPLLELVKIRASQMNGCGYCLDMHTKDARARGETEQRIYVLNAWREAPFYSDRERAALEWTEVVTNIGETHAPDDAYGRVRKQFSDGEFVALTFAIATINVWNRLAISFRSDVGSYQVSRQEAHA